MDTKLKLIESKETDKEIVDLINDPNWTNHLFVKKWNDNYAKKLKEAQEPEIGALRGQTVGDAAGALGGMQVAATLEIFNAVIRGFTRYMDDSFVKKYTTESVIFKIPKTEYKELVSNIGVGTGELPHTEKQIDYAEVRLDTPESEKGGKVTWTRALLEDVTFDVQAEMAEGLGHAIAVKILNDILTVLLGVPQLAMPLNAKKTITSPITWQEFIDVIGAVDVGITDYTVTMTAGAGNAVPSDIGKMVKDDTVEVGPLVSYDNTSPAKWVVATRATIGNGSAMTITSGTGTGTSASSVKKAGVRTYGPADFCLVSPDVYWQLLNIIQMTNVLYEGSTDPITRGVIKLALGTTIVKQSLLPVGTIIALNSQKAIALVTRRALKIEPVLFPVWNEYGFIGTVRFGITSIFNGAIQLGQIA